MSTAPSLPWLKLLWSIQTRVEYCTLIASSPQLRKLTFRMITLLTLATLSPPPVMVALLPTPMIVLLAATFCMPLIEIVPDTRITREPLACMLLISADDVVTVTGEALPPPLVPPPCVAQPCKLNVAADASGIATRAPAAASASAAAPIAGPRQRRERGRSV